MAERIGSTTWAGGDEVEPALLASAQRTWPSESVTTVAGWQLRWIAPDLLHVDLSPEESALLDPAAVDPAKLVSVTLSALSERGTSGRLMARATDADEQLDRELCRRGLQPQDRQLLMVARLDRFAGNPAASAVVRARPTPEWIDAWWAAEGLGRYTRDGALAMAKRIPPPAGFASVERGGRVVATGVGVVDGEFLGLYALHGDDEDVPAVVDQLGRFGIALGARTGFTYTDSERPRPVLDDRNFQPVVQYRTYTQP